MTYYEDRRMEYQLTGDVSASGRGAVHAAMRKVVAQTGQTPWAPYTLCGGRVSGTMVKTAREVTCKRCLRKLASAAKPEEVEPTGPDASP